MIKLFARSKVDKSQNPRTKRAVAAREIRAQEMVGETTQVAQASTFVSSTRDGARLRLQQRLLFAGVQLLISHTKEKKNYHSQKISFPIFINMIYKKKEYELYFVIQCN